MKDVTGILGLAARARKTATGEIVYTQLRARHVHLLILAEDIGDNAKKKLNDKCSFYKVPCVYMDGALMNMAIGDRNRKAIAILDKGFAEKIKKHKHEFYTEEGTCRSKGNHIQRTTECRRAGRKAEPQCE